MSLHVFGNIITAYGVAANNRGESEGNITTLQKLLWKGQVHTTVSAEAIRWAIRYYWQTKQIPVNRVWNDALDEHQFQDKSWLPWTDPEGKGKGHKTFIDDDVMGFMLAEGAKAEGSETKGTCNKRRGALEVSRAISTTPYAGDISFNAKSGLKDRTSLYGAEIHATRYQYGFALTPARLDRVDRVGDVLNALMNLGEVAGNHSRFLFDFSPESTILRVSQDPAPRILYCFDQNGREEIAVPELLRRVNAGDILAEELFIGGPISEHPQIRDLKGVNIYAGIKKAFSAFRMKVFESLGSSGEEK